MNVTIVSLVYDIMFNDADDGPCYAGEGARLLKVFATEQDAKAFVDSLLPTIEAAESETIVFPMQSNNCKLKKILGFTLNDLPQDSCNYSLRSEVLDVE